MLFDLKNLQTLKVLQDYKLESLATIAAAQGKLVEWSEGVTINTQLPCRDCNAASIALLGKRSKYLCTVCDKDKVDNFKVKFKALVTRAKNQYKQGFAQAVIN